MLATESAVDEALLSQSGRTFEFKERNLTPQHISAQLKMFFNDCDRRSVHLLNKADRWRRYSWYSFFFSSSLVLGSFPFWYWLRAQEYSVARIRKPTRVKNFFTIASSMIAGSLAINLFAASNFGFGFQSKAMTKFSAAYDLLAWESRRMQFQVDSGTFKGTHFLTERKFEYEIEDDDTRERLQAKKQGDDKMRFADLLLNAELDAKLESETNNSVRKVDRKKTFERRLFEDKLDAVSIAYYEFCDRKRVLDGWF